MTTDTGATERVAGPVPEWAGTAPVAATLDVRPLLARHEEPFQAIMAEARRVGPGQVFRLRCTFEPFPLYHVLGKQGFQHWARQHAPRDWEVFFYRAPASESAPEPASRAGQAGRSPAPAADPPAEPARPASTADDRPDGSTPESGADDWPAPARTVTIDVSDLVPPEPMIRILEALEELGAGEALLVHHVRRPVYLYPRLDELGYAYRTRELGPGRVELLIVKPASGREQRSQ